ncbi:uncharacterized protein LOC132562654 [Ylistrum balloti]|uniref:uncharacterized protein LOC132562654 n=1 Tax=Ylistrum balloti TaxID=509963 RepID=UPI002905AF91|nr:uncharacterized protein LOC132562654 [Ylistrum balloti]
MTSMCTRIFLITMYTTIVRVCSSCASTITLQAEHYSQTLVSLDTTRNKTGPYRCSWLIRASNTSHLIEIQMLNVYLSPASSCQMDNVILSKGFADEETIRVWCKGYVSHGIITTSSKSVYIRLTTTSDDVTGLIFMLKFWSTMSQTVSGPVRLGPANYFLISVSILVGTALLVGVMYLFYREYTTIKERKEQTFKKKLRVRRQGISGASGIVNTQFEMEDTSSEKETTLSYLTVSPSPDCSV